jgi:hypothetical protein
MSAKTSGKNGGQKALTTDPVSEGPARTFAVATLRAAQHIDPEFVDFVGLRELFGIKRSLAYELLRDGAIRGVSLRRRGQVRGKRLFSVDSVRAFLQEQMEASK